MEIASHFDIRNTITLYTGDCLDFLQEIPDKSAALVVTSPPYNIGKEYEKRLLSPPIWHGKKTSSRNVTEF